MKWCGEGLDRCMCLGLPIDADCYYYCCCCILLVFIPVPFLLPPLPPSLRVIGIVPLKSRLTLRYLGLLCVRGLRPMGRAGKGLYRAACF